MLAVFKEKPAELVITPELAITSKLAVTSELALPLPVYPSMMMLTKRCGLASLLLKIKGLTLEIH